MSQEPFRYDVRTAEIVEELMHQGFVVASYIPGVWTMEAPANLSTTKARKIISTVIQLYTAAKDIGRAKERYQRLMHQLNKLASE
jgi:hypothetical protein